MLRRLKMYGMAQAVEDLIQQGSPAFEAAVPILSQLLKAELAEREVRSIAYHLKAARFPASKDLAGFDFAASEINEALVRQLHRCRPCLRCHARRSCPRRTVGGGDEHTAHASCGPGVGSAGRSPHRGRVRTYEVVLSLRKRRPTWKGSTTGSPNGPRPRPRSRYLERLGDHLRGCAHAPERGHRRDDLRPGPRIAGFERRVTIAFTVDEGRVTILRLAYGGRDLEGLV